MTPPAAPAPSRSNLAQILTLEVPLVVRLGEKTMRVKDVMGLVPGAIIELPKTAESELDLLANNKPIGSGVACKVGENFGLKITFIGDVRTRLGALGPSPTEAPANG